VRDAEEKRLKREGDAPASTDEGASPEGARRSDA
jgi:hypothetical protein